MGEHFPDAENIFTNVETVGETQMTTKDDTLRVPGAEIYYKVRGTGPFLIILQGGDGDADGVGRAWCTIDGRVYGGYV